MTKPNEKRLPGRPKTTDRQHVTEVAMQAYWHKDPADVSLNAICQMAGVSKPALYREFDSEDGLACAVLDHYAEKVLADLTAVLTGGQDLQHTLNALADFACTDPRMETGCLFVKMSAARHRLGPKTRARIDDIDAALQHAFREFLQHRRLAGELPGNITPEAGAKYLSAQVVLATMQRSSGEDPGRVREMLVLALSVFSHRGAAPQP